MKFLNKKDESWRVEIEMWIIGITDGEIRTDRRVV